MRHSTFSRRFRAGVFGLFLLMLPASISTFAQPADNGNRRTENRERDRDDRDRDRDFPWGLLGLAGLAGLIGLRKPKRDVYVDQRDEPGRRG